MTKEKKIVILNKVDLTSVTEVRPWTPGFFEQIQAKLSTKSRFFSTLNKDMCFTIVFGHHECNLVSADEETASVWLNTLQKLVPIVRAVQHENQYVLYVSHFTVT